ncbi:MAG: 3'-5' exonuclease [Aeromonadaceae bacterium]
MSHIMLDLETMGNGPQAAIIAIGAVAFDLSGIKDRFYTQVSLESSVRAGLITDPSTIMWWMQQSDEARAAFKDNDKAVALGGALVQFAEWLRAASGEQVWGNGASFDNAILGNAYRAVGTEQPWKFWNDRCYRTFKSLFNAVPMQRIGTHHNALHDAESQAQHLIDNALAFGLQIN